MKKSIQKTLFLLATLFFMNYSKGQGLFYQLPADGSWVTYEVNYTYKSKDAELSGKQVMKMASVGKIIEGGQECRWIEFHISENQNGEEQIWVRKLLIPEQYLKVGQNPTLHVIRGWTKSAGETVIEPAVAIHGRWPAYLAGPLNDEKQLPKKKINSKLGVLKCKGLSGWIEFKENEDVSKVTYETRLSNKAPFGVVSSNMFFEVKTNNIPAYTINGTATLVNYGANAQSELPDYK